jgi:predicted metal-dependent phosphoesterase TrpH
MPTLKGNLHTHTTLSDGTMSPARVLEAYRDRGYDFLAFTDHEPLLGPDLERDYWAHLPAGGDGFVVLRGVETEPPAISGRHVGVIRGVEEELRIINHPAAYGLSVAEVVESVRAVGAHAVEISHHGRYHARYDTAAIPVPLLATDDAHHAREIGVSWIEVDARRDADAIVRAIKAGDFAAYFAGRQYNGGR